MDENQLIELLESTGYEVAYYEFSKKPNYPYIAYFESSSNPIGADDSVYHEFVEYKIELYTQRRRPDQMKVLEDALKSAGVFYERDQSHLPNDTTVLTVYTIEI